MNNDLFYSDLCITISNETSINECRSAIKNNF